MEVLQNNSHKRVRGTHSTVCKNREPVYQVPKNHIKRHPFICDLVEKSQARDVTTSDVAVLCRLQSTRRQKRFYTDRSRAINALHAVFSEYVNMTTFQVKISLRNASDAAGLSTVSASEREKADKHPAYTAQVSISRTSRAFRDMIDLGWIVAPDQWQVWDKDAGAWIDKVFEVTPLFFNAAGITTDRVMKVHRQRLAWINKRGDMGLSADQVSSMSLTQLKEHSRMVWRHKAFERRAKEMARKKVIRQLHDGDIAAQRKIAQARVVRALGDEIKYLDVTEFKTLVNREIAMLRKFSGISAPPN